MDNVLELQNLHVGYKKDVILRDIEMAISPGKIVTLIGPNGAGKSTILKTIVRQLKSMDGVITLSGQDMSGLSGNEVAKRLSMVMTERPKPELMTCRQVVETGRYPYVGGLGILREEDHKKVDEAIELLEASSIADKYFSEISDGQRQRIMLARALCQEPEVLILDEPTMYLDIRFKLELLTVIRNVARLRNIAVLMSLHELDLAIKVSDILAVVDGKTVSCVDTPENVLKTDIIEKLYGLDAHSYNPLTGSLYMEKQEAAPKVFVIGGGGSAIPYFYKLQREGIAFATGVLLGIDAECEMARALASKLVVTSDFSPITDLDIAKAKSIIDECEMYLCTIESFGPLNEANKELLEYAKSKGLKEWQK